MPDCLSLSIKNLSSVGSPPPLPSLEQIDTLSAVNRGAEKKSSYYITYSSKTLFLLLPLCERSKKTIRDELGAVLFPADQRQWPPPLLRGRSQSTALPILPALWPHALALGRVQGAHQAGRAVLTGAGARQAQEDGQPARQPGKESNTNCFLTSRN